MKIPTGHKQANFVQCEVSSSPYKLLCQLCFVSIGLRSLDGQDDAIGNDGEEDGVPTDKISMNQKNTGEIVLSNKSRTLKPSRM